MVAAQPWVQPATRGGAQQPTIGRLVLRTEPYPEYEGTPTDSDLLTIIRAEDITTELSPAELNSYSPFTFVYDPLVWIDEHSLDPKPWLAESWEVSADGKTYTFRLRKDVTWHDRTPLTAEDVAFSMITYRDDPYSALARFFPLMKKDPIVVDQFTVRFELSDASADWLLNACNQFIIQKKQFEEYWNSAQATGRKKTLTGYPYRSKMLVGAGAWKQVRYEPSATLPNLQYERNEDYWAGKPHFKRLIFRQVGDARPRISAWLDGRTDLLWPVTAAEVDQVKHQDGWLYSAPAVAFMCAWMNFDNPRQAAPAFLKDRTVRQALSTGIDRKGYAQAVFQGFVNESAIGTVAFPSSYNTNLRSPDYDQSQAEQMLAGAGYQKDSSGNLTGTDGQPIKLVALVQSSNQYPVDKIAVSIQEDFHKLGIDLAIDVIGPSAIARRTRQTFDYDLYFISRILFAGFSDYSYYHSSWDPRVNEQGRNFGGWKNDEADKLLDAIIREPDLNAQRSLLSMFQEIIADDLPALWLGFPTDLILVQKNVLGYQPNAMWQYWDTWKLWRSG